MARRRVVARRRSVGRAVGRPPPFSLRNSNGMTLVYSNVSVKYRVGTVVRLSRKVAARLWEVVAVV